MGLRAAILFAILINAGFYFIDREVEGLAPHLAWIDIWRYLISIPFFIVLGALTYVVRSDRILHFLALFGLVSAGAFVLVIMIPSPVAVNDFYWDGLIIVVLYPFLLMNMRYRFALTSGVIIFALFLFANHSLIEMSHGGFISAIGILMSALGIGAVGGYVLERNKRSNFLQSYLTVLAVNDLQRSNIRLESLSHIDPLTDIPNRRYFDANFEKEWSRCRRDKLSISLLLVDIDRFKPYNDSYGHPAGDHVLKQVAKCLQKSVQRPADFVARYGGEEFAVVLADTSDSGARKTGERILSDIRALYISHEHREPGEEPYITASIGAVSMVPEAADSLDTLIELADKALYEAKGRGRNRLVAKNA